MVKKKTPNKKTVKAIKDKSSIKTDIKKQVKKYELPTLPSNYKEIILTTLDCTPTAKQLLSAALKRGKKHVLLIEWNALNKVQFYGTTSDKAKILKALKQFETHINK